MYQKSNQISFDLVHNTTVGQQIYAKKNKHPLSITLILKRFLAAQPIELYGKTRRYF